MRLLRYSINATLDACCDHRATPTDEDLHRHFAESFAQADALLFHRTRIIIALFEGLMAFDRGVQSR
jgi:hypothetical protein